MAIRTFNIHNRDGLQRRHTAVTALFVTAVLYLNGVLAQSGPAITGDTATKPAIAVIEYSRWSFNWQDSSQMSTEKNLIQCLVRELTKAQTTFAILPPREFMQKAFPNLPPEAAPSSPEYIKLALTHPDVRSRIAPLNLKYMIYIAGTRELSERWGEIDCVVVPGGGGCFGATGNARKSFLSALVIDVASTKPVVSFDIEAEGQDWLAVIGVIPVWHNAPTKQKACKTLARELLEGLKL